MESELQEQQSQDVTTKKRGAPKGNRNGLRHGLRSSGVAPEFSWLARELCTFRRSLEKVVLEKHGEVDVLAAVHISAAVRGEQLARQAARWLAVEGSGLSIQDRTRVTHEITLASAARDKAVVALDLEPTAQEKANRKFRRARAAISQPQPKGET